MTASTLTPDQVIVGPGQAEAAAIKADYDIALKGLQAFVSMGLRLRDVKQRLPHGKYMDWVAKFLPGLSHRHLHRAKIIADQICEAAGIQIGQNVQFADLPADAVALIDGSESKAALISNIQDFRSDDLEAKNKALCEARWHNDPSARDEWEPLVLAGEVTYTYALRGMTGQELKGQSRPPIDYNKLITRNLSSLPKCWENWTELTDEVRTDALNKLPESISTAPLVVLHTLQKAIEDKLKGGQR